MARLRPNTRLRLARNVSAVSEAIAGMSDEHLLCRDFGHAWRPHSAERMGRGFQEALVCSRCYTVRRRLIDNRGRMLANGYTYPEGYLVQGVGRLTGDDRNGLRLAGLEALLRVSA